MTTDELKRIVELGKAATPRPWNWWTSNSTRRLGSVGRDGNVAFGQNQRDGYGDIAIQTKDMDYSEAAANSADKMAATLLRIDEFANGLRGREPYEARELLRLLGRE